MVWLRQRFFLLLHVVRLVRARSDHYSLVRAKLGPTTLSTQWNTPRGISLLYLLLLLINNDFKLQRCTGNYFCLVSHIPVITYKPATTTTTVIIPHHKCKSVCCTLLCKIVCTSNSVLKGQSIKWREDFIPKSFLVWLANEQVFNISIDQSNVI